MLLQTNSYVVPREKRAEHARLLRRFRSTLAKLGCDQFEAYEQVGPNWNGNESTGRYVQIMRFRDRKHQLQVQQAERSSPAAQQVIADFCRLINFPYQQQQGLFAVGYYTAVLPDLSARAHTAPASAEPFGGTAAAAAAASATPFGTSLQPAAEEAPAEETPAFDEQVHTEEEVAATVGVDLADEPLEETYPASEELTAEDVPPPDNGEAETLDDALEAADSAYQSHVDEEPAPEAPPPPPVAEVRPAPVHAPSPQPTRGLRHRKPAAVVPPARPAPPVPPTPPAAARPREVWSDDYTAPQGTAASQPAPTVQPASRPVAPPEAVRGNGAAKRRAITPKPPKPEAPAAPSPVAELSARLPDVAEPITNDVKLPGEIERPSESVAPLAVASFGLDFVDQDVSEDDLLLEAPPAPDARVAPEAPVIAEAPRPVPPEQPVTPAAPVLPPSLPVLREEHAPVVAEAKEPADAAPLAIEPEVIPAEDDFAWPEEAADIGNALTAEPEPEPVAEKAQEPSNAARLELAKEEPIVEVPSAALPQVPERPAEVIASEPEPDEPLTFADVQPAEVEHAPLADAPETGSASDLGLLAAEPFAETEEHPFESLADALEVSDDALEAPSSEPFAAAQPVRPAGSNGNGALSLTSAAKKSAAAFTDEDIDAALNEALRQLDGLDDLSEAAVPARGRAAAR